MSRLKEIQSFTLGQFKKLRQALASGDRREHLSAWARNLPKEAKKEFPDESATLQRLLKDPRREIRRVFLNPNVKKKSKRAKTSPTMKSDGPSEKRRENGQAAQL